MRQFYAIACAAMTLTLVMFGCLRRTLPKLPLTSPIDFPADLPPAEVIVAPDMAIFSWIAGASFLLAAACVFLCIVGVGIFGVGLSWIRKLAAAGVGVGVASLILKIVLVKYLWLLVLLAVAGGGVSMLLFAWGHVKVLETVFNIDFNRDGTIGEKHA